MEGEAKSLINVCVAIVGSLCYCYFLSARIPKGAYRLISMLPIFYLFTILPLCFYSAFLTGIVTFFITWLANFKLLLFCFDLGPLSLDPPKSLAMFIFLIALPIRIKQKKDHPPSQRPIKKLPLNLATESLVFAVSLGLLYDYREHLHPKMLVVLYCCMAFLLIDVLIAFSSAIVRALTGLELEPPSDEPYLSTSLQDFWGRRWNLMVTNGLRDTVYKPVKSASAALVGEKWAPLPAVLAAFVVSGLLHELLLYYLHRASPTWEMTSFFVVHGICVVGEICLKQSLTDKWRFPWFISGPLTVGFVVATSFWLFFPPLVRGGVDVRVIEEFRIFLEFIKTNLKLPFSEGQGSA